MNTRTQLNFDCSKPIKVKQIFELFSLFCFSFALILVTFSSHAQKAQKDTASFGERVWMTENLSVATFRNGDVLFHAKSRKEWKKAIKKRIPAYCIIWEGTEFEELEHAEIYGFIYNIYAVIDDRQLAPEGFSIPTFNEWVALIDFFGGEELAGVMMKSADGWYNQGNGCGLYEFNARPGGGRYGNGSFLPETTHANYWVSDLIDNGPGYNDYIHFFYGDRTVVICPLRDIGSGMYVRCIQE